MRLTVGRTVVAHLQGPPMTLMLRRTRRAGPRLLSGLFAAVVTLALVGALLCVALGLWVLLPVIVLGGLAAAVACHDHGRGAADYERIELRDGQVHVERVGAGFALRWRGTAIWTRVEQVAELGGTRVVLASAGQFVEVGRLLPEAARRRLAQDLRTALRTAA